MQRQTVAVPEVAATPILKPIPDWPQLSELLAQVGQVQFEMDALSHEEVHVEPFQLEAEVVDSEPLVALAEPMVEAVVEGGRARRPRGGRTRARPRGGARTVDLGEPGYRQRVSGALLRRGRGDVCRCL